MGARKKTLSARNRYRDVHRSRTVGLAPYEIFERKPHTNGSEEWELGREASRPSSGIASVVSGHARVRCRPLGVYGKVRTQDADGKNFDPDFRFKITKPGLS
jgi:hypothetical protein